MACAAKSKSGPIRTLGDRNFSRLRSIFVPFTRPNELATRNRESKIYVNGNVESKDNREFRLFLAVKTCVKSTYKLKVR